MVFKKQLFSFFLALTILISVNVNAFLSEVLPVVTGLNAILQLSERSDKLVTAIGPNKESYKDTCKKVIAGLTIIVATVVITEKYLEYRNNKKG